MVLSTCCGVGMVDHGFIYPLWCGCDAGNGGGNGCKYKASASGRGFWVPDLLQHNPGSKIQGSGGGDPNMRVFDGIIRATSPHLLTRWRVKRVHLGKAVSVSTFEM